MYKIYENGKIKEQSNLIDIRQLSNTYDLWIDLDANIIKEKKQGSINLGSKRILGRLLVFLVMNADKTYFPEELYEAVWNQKALGLSEHTTIRTGISRLRNLIEPKSPQWKYIKKTQVTFWNPLGAYFFDSSSNYCLIMRKKCILFPM